MPVGPVLHLLPVPEVVSGACRKHIFHSAGSGSPVRPSHSSVIPQTILMGALKLRWRTKLRILGRQEWLPNLQGPLSMYMWIVALSTWKPIIIISTWKFIINIPFAVSLPETYQNSCLLCLVLPWIYFCHFRGIVGWRAG